MEQKLDLQCNRVFYLENSMVMYGVYNSDTLQKLIQTVHRMQNRTSWTKRHFAGKLNDWFEFYVTSNGVHQYAVTSVLYLLTIKEK